ncbi:hypothetical protein O3M35_002859 [Rhynocoris fuscipes]|uniref:SKA complex subunit 1 n=1 Tax=Rhynocoris fuscipes TaxID=488301 RepID=A0AAW1CNE8_9HEMI
MDCMLRKVRQLKRIVVILDGLEDDIEEKCRSFLENECVEIKNILTLRREKFEERKNYHEDVKNVIENLEIMNDRIEYMQTNLPNVCIDGNTNLENVPPSPQNGVLQVPNQIKYAPSPEPVAPANFTSPVSVPMSERTVLTVQTPKPRTDMEISISYVSNNEFSEVPDYMKGRLKINDVNSFVDIFNKALTKKYALLKRTKNSIKLKNELDKYVKWKGQINSDTKDLYFCTAEDFFTECGLKLGKKEFSLLTILRHLKRTREIRQKKLVFYVACF